MDDVRLIDANAAIENADKRYSEWNLAMAAAEGNRQISINREFLIPSIFAARFA